MNWHDVVHYTVAAILAAALAVGWSALRANIKSQLAEHTVVHSFGFGEAQPQQR